MQAVVDSEGLYLSVATGYPGSLHDSRVLRLSQLCDAAEDELILANPTFEINNNGNVTVTRPIIVGDAAHPLKPQLL